MNLKLRRVAPGYYRSRRNCTVTITRVTPPCGGRYWYYQIDEGDVHDWYDTKRDAVAACIDFLRFGA